MFKTIYHIWQYYNWILLLDVKSLGNKNMEYKVKCKCWRIRKVSHLTRIKLCAHCWRWDMHARALSFVWKINWLFKVIWTKKTRRDWWLQEWLIVKCTGCWKKTVQIPSYFLSHKWCRGCLDNVSKYNKNLVPDKILNDLVWQQHGNYICLSRRRWIFGKAIHQRNIILKVKCLGCWWIHEFRKSSWGKSFGCKNCAWKVKAMRNNNYSLLPVTINHWKNIRWWRHILNTLSSLN